VGQGQGQGIHDSLRWLSGLRTKYFGVLENYQGFVKYFGFRVP